MSQVENADVFKPGEEVLFDGKVYTFVDYSWALDRKSREARIKRTRDGAPIYAKPSELKRVNNSTAFLNGRAKAERELGMKVENAHYKAKVGDTVIWRGREFDVVAEKGIQIVISDEGERYTVDRADVKPGIIK